MSTPVEKEKRSEDANALGLDSTELDILRKQTEVPPDHAGGYLAVYGYAIRTEIIVMALATVMSVTSGACLPLMTIVFGSLTQRFSDLTSGNAFTDFGDTTNGLVLYLVYIGIAWFLSTSLAVFGFSFTGKRITRRLRKAYLESLLRQNIAFFDASGAGEATTRLTADLNLVQDGISEKVALTIAGLSGFVTAIIIAFVRSWRLALVLLCQPIVFAGVMVVIGGNMARAQKASLTGYAAAATLAEEAFSTIRTVAAYGTQKRMAARYDAALVAPAKHDFMSKALLGLFIGAMVFLQLSAFALAFWQGNRFLQDGVATISEILTTVYVMAVAAFQLGTVAPHGAAFATASAAAAKIFGTLSRHSPISLEGGLKLDEIEGHIQFRDVKLVYPSRPTQVVLENFNLDIPAGRTTAIVGPSGSGKSSLVSLLERFYVPLRGQILLDGHDVSNLNLAWLRSQIGLVSQDPFLFDTSIFDNIAMGLVGSQWEAADEATKKTLVEGASRIALAHDFVSALTDGYDTRVGERGSLLSGGQRQRIAIARSIVSNPKILLLDEATSALDTRSEGAVQEALSNAMRGRTVLAIAHRLSSIRQSSKISVLSSGRVIEEGSHEELLQKPDSTYALLVKAQQLQGSVADAGVKEDTEDDVNDHIPIEKSKTIESAKAQLSAAKISRWELLKFVWSLNKPERNWLVVGLIGSFLSGVGYPLMAITFGNAAMALSDPRLTTGGYGIDVWAGIQWAIAWFVLLAYSVHEVPLAMASARLVSRARSMAFMGILKQDMTFFSKAENSSGALTAFLAVQTQQLNGLSGGTLGAICNAAFTVITASAVAISFGWKMGLVAVSTFPVLIASGYFRFSVTKDLERENLASTEAASIATEAVGHGIRTVASMGLENMVLDRYMTRLTKEIKSSLLKSALSAALYGFAQASTIFVMALLFWYGGTHLIETGEYTVGNFLICFASAAWGASAAGSVFSHAPDVAGGQAAALRLKGFLDSVPDIDIDEEGGESADAIEGNMGLHDVVFAYSGHPNHSVLRNVSLSTQRGQFIGLVGASGSGKSSVLNLLERFYDPLSGTVTTDGRDLRGYNLQSLRKQIALVQQDSMLYGGSLRENIMSDDEDVSDVDIQAACEEANIWDFVQSLPEGLGTTVGARGSTVSGGQKQRLAIARALLRKPKILLLDEATSALDSVSERVVQQALDAAALGRTTICISHRLSTVTHANCLYVFKEGRVVEQGTYEELMAKRGLFFEFVGLQHLGS